MNRRGLRYNGLRRSRGIHVVSGWLREGGGGEGGRLGDETENRLVCDATERICSDVI